VINANTGAGGTPQALLDGFHPALFVPVIVGVLGIVAVAGGLRTRVRTVAVTEAELAEAA
jgi:hypothetical protein